jgi:hypothetical protein
MVRPKSRINIPDRKISETFLEFAEPLLVPLGPGATEQEMNQALQIAFAVWNAVVYETVNDDTQYLDMLQDLTAGQPEVVAIVNPLIERKRQQFGNDHRLVGNFKLTIQNGELNLRAEARDPTAPNK